MSNEYQFAVVSDEGETIGLMTIHASNYDAAYMRAAVLAQEKYGDQVDHLEKVASLHEIEHDEAGNTYSN